MGQLPGNDRWLASLMSALLKVPLITLILFSLVTAYFAFGSIRAYQDFSANLADFYQTHSTQQISAQVDKQGVRITALDHKISVAIPKMLTREKLFQPPQPRQINWFSFALGARVIRNEDISSPPSGGVFSDLLLMAPGEPGTPMYCGPGVVRLHGKLQVGIATPRVVTPVTLTIEHFRKDEVLNIGSAPKVVELWVELKDESIRRAVREEIVQYYPHIFTPQSFQSTKYPIQKLLNDEWVPIGQWSYDIRAGEKVQDFQPPVDLNMLKVASDHFVVRVNSNWGDRAETCLAQVRLQGIGRGKEEYLEQPDKLTEEEAMFVEYL